MESEPREEESLEKDMLMDEESLPHDGAEDEEDELDVTTDMAMGTTN